jgi:hypothetical protein
LEASRNVQNDGRPSCMNEWQKGKKERKCN